jgi:hypothetical protein
MCERGLVDKKPVGVAAGEPERSIGQFCCDAVLMTGDDWARYANAPANLIRQLVGPGCPRA